ncbi:MAG: sigma-70 family RNA polymerase sigma factor, partial [Acidobacteria bacterium]|nr:sigma-70 family RNA polymerase sigma factor [Acidobacteriota bacterium]
QEGDREALGELFDRHAGLVYGIGLRILKDAGEADDLVQEVFLFLFRKSALFNPAKGSARSWLVQVTYCRAFDRRDYLGTRAHYRQSAVEDCVATIGANGNMLSSAELFYWSSYLRRSFEELSNGQRQTLRLYFFEGYSLLEISEKLGETLVNVRHHYHRGLERLRKLMLQSGRSRRPIA